MAIASPKRRVQRMNGYSCADDRPFQNRTNKPALIRCAFHCNFTGVPEGSTEPPSKVSSLLLVAVWSNAVNAPMVGVIKCR